MPKKVIETSSYANSNLYTHQHKLSQHNSHIPKKTRYIQKLDHHSSKYKEECKEQIVELLSDLFTVINKQFHDCASLFKKQTIKPTKNLLNPHVTEKGNKLEFYITILPTIKECSKIAEQEQEHIKKEKEQTQMSSAGQKVW